MLDNKGFDIWAESYDEYVANSKGYPFEGYYEVLTFVFNQIKIIESRSILDIGFGTGTLTNKIYEKGAQIYGVDFSIEMIKIAREKMPNGRFVQNDFNKGLPEELRCIKFDYIISTYAFHHLDTEAKIRFIIELKNVLKDNGRIIIGDISFGTKRSFEDAKRECGDGWDNDEIYIIEEEFSKLLNKENIKYTYTQISKCASVYVIW